MPGEKESGGQRFSSGRDSQMREISLTGTEEHRDQKSGERNSKHVKSTKNIQTQQGLSYTAVPAPPPAQVSAHLGRRRVWPC